VGFVGFVAAFAWWASTERGLFFRTAFD